MYEQAATMLTPATPGLLPMVSEKDSTRKDPLELSDKEVLVWVRHNDEAISLAIEASRGKVHPHEGSPLECIYLARMARFVGWHAVTLEKEGKLDAAFDEYMAALRIAQHLRDLDALADANLAESFVFAHLLTWSIQPGQTKTRLADAVRQLGKLGDRASGQIQMKLAYLRMKQAINGDPMAMASEFGKSGFVAFWLRLPWERQRALRQLDKYAAAYREKWQLLETDTSYDPTTTCHVESSNAPRINWLMIVNWGLPNRSNFEDEFYCHGKMYISWKTSYNALQLILALEGWKLEHGTLPQKLEELVGPFFDRLPKDAFSGESFVYYRDGLHERLFLPQSTAPQWAKLGIQELAGDKPVLWSTGPYVRRTSKAGNTLQQYECWADNRASIGQNSSRWQSPSSIYALQWSGWSFPIPEAKKK
jgi:hypothetical protein